MKTKIVKSTILVAILGVALWSCNKTNIDSNTSNNSELSEVLVQKLDVNSNASIKVKCINTCDDGEECGMRWDMNAGSIECTCSGCSMELSSTVNLANEISHLGNYFVEYLLTNYNTSDFILHLIEINSYDNSKTILFEFEITNSGEIGTVMYVDNYDNIGTVIGPTLEVDCAGFCDTESESCRERFISSTGNVECTCQSDNCSMTITQKNEK